MSFRIGKQESVPTEGEYVIQAGYRFTVEQTTERGIAKLRVEKSG